MASVPRKVNAISSNAFRPAPGECPRLVEQLVEEMGRRWQGGERPVAEEFFDRYPEFWEQPEAALELIAEELSLRQEFGEETDAAELERRFPRWQRPVRTLARCHQLLAPSFPAARWPTVGDTLGDFRLLTELGRGAHGRVFLATQPSLAGRPVVLKLGPDGGVEHLWLARLQHTHIVPLFSIHEFPDRGLYALCLPYLGGATLANLLDGLRPPGQRTGRDLLEALKKSRADAPVSIPVEGPACRFLDRASYVRAVCWMGVCLADALQYAHERGLVHLDLKPSNVLLAADGQPLLLDFHLARESLAAGAPPPPLLGGTPGYMAPEHRAAVAAVRERRAIPQAVDGRADVYSLGMVLHEALAGSLPASEEKAPALRQHNPRVTVGLADLLRKCLEAEPARRYATAGALAADLRRYLADLPLREVRNRSLAERWRRWRRRRPHDLPLLGMLAIALAGGAMLFVYANRQADKARSALQQGRLCLRAGHHAEALDHFRNGVALAEDLPFTGELVRELHDGENLAERGGAAAELHRSCERLRAWYDAGPLSAARRREAEDLCGKIWQNRELIAQRLAHQPASELNEQVRADLIEVAILWSDLRVRGSRSSDVGRARNEALQVLREAESLFGPSPALRLARRNYRHVLESSND